jgi:hypothetical protein
VDPPEVDLESVRARARSNSRRTVALALAAAVVAVALGAAPLLDEGRSRTVPQPAVPPRSVIVLPLPFTDCRAEPCLRPRVYGIPLGLDAEGRRLRAKLVVPTSGWDSAWDAHRISRSSAEGEVVLSVYQPHGFPTTHRPCDAEARTTVATDATVDDVAHELSSLPQFAVVDGPHARPAFGRATRYLKVRAERLTCDRAHGDNYQLADIYWGAGEEPGGESAIEPGRPVLIEFWVLDLDGKPVVVEARQEGAPGEALVRQLDQVRESLTFGLRQ